MDKVELPKFYELGASFRPLVDLDTAQAPGSGSGHQIRVVIFADNAVRMLLRDNPELHYCRAAGEKLVENADAWLRSLEVNPGSKLLAPKSKASITALITQAQKFEHLLTEELRSESVFRVTQVGMYNTVSLIEQADLDYPHSVREKLRPEVVTEIRECGRCLAYGVATAAAFHALRALELIMLDYWTEVCELSPKPTKLDNWGQCISQLRDKSDPALPNPPHPDVAKAVALLQQLKDDDRNLIMHPARVLEADEALILFKLCQTATIAMVDRLPLASTTQAATGSSPSPDGVSSVIS